MVLGLIGFGQVMEPFNAWSTRLIELKKMIEHARAMRLDWSVCSRCLTLRHFVGDEHAELRLSCSY